MLSSLPTVADTSFVLREVGDASTISAVAGSYLLRPSMGVQVDYGKEDLPDADLLPLQSLSSSLVHEIAVIAATTNYYCTRAMIGHR